MSDEKYIDEIDAIEQEDMIPNPPYVNKAPKYILIALVLLLGVISALAVVFTADKDKNAEENRSDTVNVQYII